MKKKLTLRRETVTLLGNSGGRVLGGADPVTGRCVDTDYCLVTERQKTCFNCLSYNACKLSDDVPCVILSEFCVKTDDCIVSGACQETDVCILTYTC